MRTAEVHTKKNGFIGKFRFNTNDLSPSRFERYDKRQDIFYECEHLLTLPEIDAWMYLNNHWFDGTARFKVGEEEFLITKSN